MHLGDATWTDAAAADPDVALLPVGSTEQHGPHAPLATDALTASAVAAAAADRYEGELVVAPTLPIGVSEEHRDFAGTLWVSADTFRAYVRETAEALASHGWDRIVVVNGHGGNTEALADVTADLSRHTDAYAVAFTWFTAVGDHSEEMGHAGPLETAFLRHVHPELVHEDRVDDAADGASDRWGEWVAGVNLAHDASEFSENGVVGDPRDGDAARGAELEGLAADSLVELARAVATRDLD